MDTVMSFDQERANRFMYLCRAVDEQIAERYDQGPDGTMKTPTHLSTGQEASAVGVMMALPKSAHVFSTHRNHAHYLAKGGNLDAMIAEIHGKATGCLGGRGGSMHLADESVGFMGGFPIVGDAISLATGSALAAKFDGSDRVTAVFFGDGAVESGQLWESMNFAQTHSLKLLYVCENNGLATATPISDRQPNDFIWTLVSLLNKGDRDSTGNVETICDKAKALLSSLPAFIEIKVTRYREHVGPGWTGDARAWASDFGSHPDIDRLIAQAFERAEGAPWPEVSFDL